MPPKQTDKRSSGYTRRPANAAARKPATQSARPARPARKAQSARPTRPHAKSKPKTSRGKGPQRGRIRPQVQEERKPAPINKKLKIYALGGLEEIGRNCTVLECGDDILIVDAGFMFPEEDMHGIDYIVPNITSLKGKEKNIRGIIVTHGHMDHIGAFPHILGPLGNPVIYTAPLTAGMIRKRMEEHREAPKPNIVIVKRDTEKFKLGKNFHFQPFHINHNISDAFGAAIDTPYGKVLMTGDFKFDYSPVNEEPADLQRIAMFGAEKPLLLCSDSTDSEHEGYQSQRKLWVKNWIVRLHHRKIASS